MLIETSERSGVRLVTIPADPVAPTVPRPMLASVPHTDADLVVVATLDGRCLDVSPTVVPMLGVEPGDVIGRLLADAVDPDDRATIQAALQRVTRSGSVRMTIRLHHRAGHLVWLDVSAKLLPADDGDDDTHVFVLARDVTDDVLALEHLALSEQQWRLAFEHSPIGAALVSADGDIRLANGSLAAMLEHRQDALTMMTLDDVTHPEDRTLDHERMAELLSGASQTYTVEKRYLTSTGRFLWGQMTAAAVPDLHGKVN